MGEKVTGSLENPHIMYASGWWHVRIPIISGSDKLFLLAHEKTREIAFDVAARRREPTRRYG